jgi:hypothetical protein
MDDIRIAIALLALVTVIVFSVTFRVLKPRSKWFLDFSAALVVVLMVVYGYFMFGQLWIVEWIPLPSVIVLANWFPPLMGALAAVVWLRLDPASIWRRLPIMFLLCGAAVYSVMFLIPTRPPECSEKWARPKPPMVWPVCLQTTPYTCSAASSATILNCLGIKTTEQEMAELCLTRSGTSWLGLYHGLATMLLDSKYRLVFFQADAERLEKLTSDGPVLLCCMLDPEIAKLVPEYVAEGGWIPGLAHSVVYFGKVGDRHIIGDPSRGYESWTARDLNMVWSGTGLGVVLKTKPTSNQEAGGL